jgi:hypothetical protein
VKMTETSRPKETSWRAELSNGQFASLSSWEAGSNCAKLYFSVSYATLTGQFGFGLGEAGSRCARSFPRGMNARARPRVGELFGHFQ